MPTTDDQEHTLALARDLIACASVTPEDAGCQSLMMTRLQQVGFSVEPMRFGEVDNFWATRGASGPLHTVHTDISCAARRPSSSSAHGGFREYSLQKRV